MKSYLYITLSLLLSSLLFTTFSTVADSPSITYLEQNWTNQDRQYFYFADQGSRLITYDYFINLEQAQSDQLLRSDNNMLRFGFIPAEKSSNNPDGLPIGLARNGNKMGPTCAACHTQQITYEDKIIRVDGGQGFIDLQRFLAAIKSSLKATLDDKEKFVRFQKRLYGKKVSQQQQELLRLNLQIEHKKRNRYDAQNYSDIDFGFSRTAAFDVILNRALVATGEVNNTYSTTGLTNFPYIWDTPQHDYVEWNGSQSNTGVGALSRNIGEVIGVFADIETEPTKWLGFIDGGYQSSIQVKELRKLEDVVSKLHSPLWPDSFPAIDTTLAKQGRGLYEQHCIQCHVDIERTDPLRKIQVRMSTLSEINTDPLMAENAINFVGKSGKFEGRSHYYDSGDKLEKQARAIHIANNLMVGVLRNNPIQSYLAKRDANKLGHPDVVHPPKYVDGKVIEHGQEVSDYALLAYKARPLNGVWSGAPFLHNGSIPNLYQLLLPVELRMKEFYLGSIEYDPINVGYVSKRASSSFLFDTRIKGNRNSGHEFAAGHDGKPALTEQQRWALIEYLKTL